MNHLKQARSLSLGTLFVVLVLSWAVPEPASAQWQRRDDDLPGTISTETLILVGVVTFGAMYFIMHSIRKSSEPAAEPADENPAPDDSTETCLLNLIETDACVALIDSTSSYSSSPSSRKGSLSIPDRHQRIRPILGVGRGEVVVGLSFRL
ncbi:MAG: hypothetical protein KAY32_15550 [Candidatus Eisenbacteria sp.]|nr:hypothetical protein [Candidatus Eisenbacteria bacterium]